MIDIEYFNDPIAMMATINAMGKLTRASSIGAINNIRLSVWGGSGKLTTAGTCWSKFRTGIVLNCIWTEPTCAGV